MQVIFCRLLPETWMAPVSAVVRLPELRPATERRRWPPCQQSDRGGTGRSTPVKAGMSKELGVLAWLLGVLGRDLKT